MAALVVVYFLCPYAFWLPLTIFYNSEREMPPALLKAVVVFQAPVFFLAENIEVYEEFLEKEAEVLGLASY